MLITINDIKDFCPAADNLSDSVITMYIALVNQADACLTSNGVDCEIAKLYKLSAVCHFLTRKFGGTITSQSDFDGASVSFNTYMTSGFGLSATTFGQDILSSPYASCFIFMNAKSNRFMQSVGRDCE